MRPADEMWLMNEALSGDKEQPMNEAHPGNETQLAKEVRIWHGRKAEL